MSIGANGRGLVSDSPYVNGDSLSKLKLSRDGLGASPDTEIDAIAAEIKARPPLSPAEQRWQGTLNQSDDYAEYENDRLLARAPAPVPEKFGSEALAIGAVEGFFTFNRAGQIIKGVGLGLKAPLDMVEGAANLLQDGYGYSAEALTGDPYQAKSGLIRSVQSQGLVATAGDLFVNTVKSLPIIGTFNSIYRNDMVGLGQSLPATVGLGAGLRGVGTNSGRYGGNAELLKWDLAEQAGIPRSINLAKPDNVWGLSYRDLKTHFELNGYEALPDSRATSNAQVFKLTNHREISKVQFHPGEGSHEGSYYKFEFKGPKSSNVRVNIVDPETYVPKTIRPNDIFFDQQGNRINFK